MAEKGTNGTAGAQEDVVMVRVVEEEQRRKKDAFRATTEGRCNKHQKNA